MTFAGNNEQAEAKAHSGHHEASEHTHNLQQHVHDLRTQGHGHDKQAHQPASSADHHLPDCSIVDHAVQATENGIANGAKAAEAAYKGAAQQMQNATHWFTHDLCHDNPVEMATVGTLAAGTAVLTAPAWGGVAIVEGTGAAAVGALTFVAGMGAMGMGINHAQNPKA
jgi:hypothetical protein